MVKRGFQDWKWSVLSKVSINVYELGFMILVIYIGLEPYPIGSEFFFDFLKIVGNPSPIMDYKDSVALKQIVKTTLFHKL